MNRTNTPAISEAILQLQRQLDQFRSTQPRRTLPESLWQAAVELARNTAYIPSRTHCGSTARENGKRLDGRQPRPHTLRKSGNSIAPVLANPRSHVECRSGAPRSAES